MPRSLLRWSTSRGRVGPIDRLVNAAAIAPAGRLDEQPLDEIRRLMEINYIGLATATKVVLPRMLDAAKVTWCSSARWPVGCRASASVPTRRPRRP